MGINANDKKRKTPQADSQLDTLQTKDYRDFITNNTGQCMKFIRNNILWVIYFSFSAVILFVHNREPIFISSGTGAVGKYIAWATLLLFLAYSLYCHRKENFFKTIPKLTPYFWFKQISLDLYLGLLIPLSIIFLDQGLIVMLIWLVPIILMANLATLLYIALNFQTLISYFIG